jgi:ADP-ribose pyrophosphatase
MTSPSPESLRSRSYVYRGRIIRLRVDTIELAKGRTTTREIVEHPGASVIVAVDDQGRVGMVRQYRSAIGRESLELPAGTREPPETPAECAARELGEELGVTAGRWYPLIEFYSSPGFCTELLSVFVATSIFPAPGEPEDDESIKREWIKLSAIPDLIARGALCDAKSIAGLLAFGQRDSSGSAPWQS